MIQTKSRNEMQLTQSLSKLKRLKRYAITYVIKKYDQESFVTDVFVDSRMISRTLGTWSKTFCSEDIPFCMAFYRLSKLMWADREKKKSISKTQYAPCGLGQLGRYFLYSAHICYAHVLKLMIRFGFESQNIFSFRFSGLLRRTVGANSPFVDVLPDAVNCLENILTF